MKEKARWIISLVWDASSGAPPPKLVCVHVHGDAAEHPCNISPMTELCERSLVAGECLPGTVIKCLACGTLMAKEDEITFRP